MPALYGAMSPRLRRRLWLALALMFGGALAELVTIGAVLPFLALLADPGRAGDIPGFALLMGEGRAPADLLVFATLLFAGAALVAAAVRIAILRVTQGFVLALGHEVGTSIFGRMLRQPYSLYVSRNSSELVASVEKVQLLISMVLMPLMQGVTATIIAIAILSLLVAIDPGTAAAAAAMVALLYVLISLATRRLLRRNSGVVAGMATARIKAVQEGMAGIRDILLEQSQPVFEAHYRAVDAAYRRAQATQIFVSTAPRFVVEAAGIILVALVALYMSGRPGGIVAAIPVLGALALGAQRLLPLVQNAYFGWAQLSGNVQVLRDVAELLQAPVVAASGRIPRGGVVPFQADIVFDKVGFRYPGRGATLHDVSLVIPKGARIGIVGKTGSGKSSFLDLLMGLLDPSAGEIRVDGQRLEGIARDHWQAQIAHVPQIIHLADSSISANIAFGEAAGDIDLERVRAAARRAELDDFILGLPEGYDTLVGERGVRLSGGQRQRVALARALYKEATVLILDEATTALDPQTEKAVIDGISGLGPEMTLLIVAHRLSALTVCDVIVRFEEGRIAEVTSYEEAARAASAA